MLSSFFHLLSLSLGEFLYLFFSIACFKNVLEKIAKALAFPLDKLLSFEEEKGSIPEFFETITIFQKVSPKYLDLIKRVLKEIIRWEKGNF